MAIDVDRLKEVLKYEPDTGDWIWIKSLSNAAPVGHICNYRPGGYLKIRIDGKLYRAGRLAFLYMTGKWPKGIIDHKDRNPFNDRWNNYRDVTQSDNMKNISARSDNTSGYKGVSFNKQHKKWESYINSKGKRFGLGLYTDIKEAVKVRIEAEKKFGFVKMKRIKS